MHYVAPPKIKSTNDFTSRIEARSARANAPVGQVNFETKLDQVVNQFLLQDVVLGKGLVRKPDGVISSIKIYGIKDNLYLFLLLLFIIIIIYL